MFIKKSGDFCNYKKLGNTRKVNVGIRISLSISKSSRRELMNQAWQNSFKALKDAYEEGIEYLIIKHENSLSKRGDMTVGSQIRNLMRSHAAGPYIIRSKSIQYKSAFIAAIRPKETVD